MTGRRADLTKKDKVMPKLSERDRLAELEARQRKATEEVVSARATLRKRYALIVQEHSVEQFSERDFHELLSHAIRVGGAPSIAALKALPSG
jgi:hypothetical protein